MNAIDPLPIQAARPQSVTVVTPTDKQLLEAVRLGEVFIRETPTYSRLAPLDVAKMIEFAYNCRASDAEFFRVAVRGEQVIGFFIGGVTSYGFDTASFAFDRMLYVSPNKRGTHTARMLIEAFEDWAHDMGASDIVLGITTGLHTNATERFFNKLGYRTVGKVTMKEIM